MILFLFSLHKNFPIFPLTDQHSNTKRDTENISKSALLYDWRFTANPPWPQAPSGSQPEILERGGAEPLQSQSLRNILSDEKMGLSLMNMLGLCQVYVSHIQHVIENSSLCTIYQSSVSTGFTEQIMPILRILCYNGGLII
jgi:hypothetical protein